MSADLIAELSSPTCSSQRLREVIMGGCPDAILEQALRHPNCPEDALQFILDRGVMDIASAIVVRNPNAPESSVYNWYRKHQRTVLPADPTAAINQLSPAQMKRRNKSVFFPGDPMPTGEFYHYFLTVFRTQLLRFVLGIHPASRHHPDRNRVAADYEKLDCSYFASNFMLPFGSQNAVPYLEGTPRWQTGLDEVVIQPWTLEKHKDKPDLLAHVEDAYLPFFAVSLYLVVLFDQVAFTHFHPVYPKWRALTMFPKLKGNCMGGCGHHMPAAEIFRILKPRLEPVGGRQALHPRFNQAVIDALGDYRMWMEYFFCDNLTEVDTDEFAKHCWEATRRFVRLPK